MKALKVFTIVVMLLFAFIIATLTVRSQTGIIVNNADSVLDSGISGLSGTIEVLLNQVTPRVVFEFADSNRSQELPPLPSLLNGLLSQVTPRIVFDFANSSRQHELVYPQEILNDNAPPQIASIESVPTGDTSTDISWTTDEYSNGTVQCGTQPGIYTMTFFAPLYEKMHVIALTGLTAGTTYYCQINSIDLSDNTSQSQEFSFEQLEEFFIYLPSVIR